MDMQRETNYYMRYYEWRAGLMLEVTDLASAKPDHQHQLSMHRAWILGY